MADATKITAALLREYPSPRIALHFSNALELLVATILSAQCTDIRVNKVTETLFKQYTCTQDYANADLETFEQEIRPTGFYKNKAQTVINCCKRLVEDFGGEVPGTVDELTTLPGVGRKTANLVLGGAFKQHAIAVDTHVLRVSNRLGLSDSKNPDKVELDLMDQVPRKKWTPFTLAMILHGRKVCTARRPNCEGCMLNDLCEWPEKPIA